MSDRLVPAGAPTLAVMAVGLHLPCKWAAAGDRRSREGILMQLEQGIEGATEHKESAVAHGVQKRAIGKCQQSI